MIFFFTKEIKCYKHNKIVNQIWQTNIKIELKLSKS